LCKMERTSNQILVANSNLATRLEYSLQPAGGNQTTTGGNNQIARMLDTLNA